MLKFIPDQDSGLKATSAHGRYTIIDYGREGWDAIFTAPTGDETSVPPLRGGRFHAGSRHAIAACQEHNRRLSEPPPA